ncbi:MAG: radical SAM family heme chaperone HemW [Acidimicrobiia bacterium]|nr:radical SAM family heme chaperone HemW [Acidimicrobiia bacterium]
MSDRQADKSIARTLPARDPLLADAAHEWKSAYIHIPFCRRRCPYCDFAIVDESAVRSDHARYAEAVLAEIEMEEGIGRLDAVNVGGGTPSLIDPAHLADMLDALERRFAFAPDVERSLEINPEDWTVERADAWVAAGFDRISIGLQSLDDEVLGDLGRMHRASIIAEVVSEARAAGFRSINVDLIFGHPGEPAASWRSTVDRVMDLDVDHVSTYALTVEAGTELGRSVSDGAPAPDDDVQAERYEHFVAAASSRGIVAYEVSNHARDGHACRYNLSTWAHGEYLGFGLAAHDHRWGIRGRNHRRMDRYVEDIDAGRRPRLGTETLDRRDQERDRLMLGLRLAAGTPMTDTAEAFVRSEAGARFVDAGVIRIEGGRLVLSNPLVADAVAREALSVSASDC